LLSDINFSLNAPLDLSNRTIHAQIVAAFINIAILHNRKDLHGHIASLKGRGVEE
jgi:hypothetical protein